MRKLQQMNGGHYDVPVRALAIRGAGRVLHSTGAERVPLADQCSDSIL
ncbi:MAG TPA: hypothetical protein PKE41_02070 [Candidatus Macondimonas sp.]|jgi:hypothetical protein|nr:hypothetical protein [Candidatus Macondimonas sp.]